MLGFLSKIWVTNVPNVDFVIVLLLLDDFRRGVKRSPASCVSQKGRVNGPSKITNFNDSLGQARSTSWKRMF
jgi:hypothetical protein